jgi:hypothetical protein
MRNLEGHRRDHEMKVEEEYLDVLQNIEFVIVSAFRRHPELSDHGVMRALEAVTDSYAAEIVGRAPRQFGLSFEEQDVFTAVKDICDWRLGRTDLSSGSAERAVEIKPITVNEISLCLKRLLKSVRTWNSQGGSQGYLRFVSGYF